MKIIERYRSGAVSPTREWRKQESEVDRLQRQLRRATERNHTIFDQGFQAAILMLEAGATMERLKEASGVVACEWADTEPVCLITQDPALDEITQVDAMPWMPS